MTSKPASRRAAATTFAPRSWPSRPGLATITRNFLRLACFIGLPIDRRFAPFSELRLERVDDFPERHAPFDPVEERGHEVGAVAGGRPDRLQGPEHRSSVPALLELADFGDLVALDSRIDLEGRHGLAVLFHELIHADVDVPTLLH